MASPVAIASAKPAGAGGTKVSIAASPISGHDHQVSSPSEFVADVVDVGRRIAELLERLVQDDAHVLEILSRDAEPGMSPAQRLIVERVVAIHDAGDHPGLVVDQLGHVDI